MTGKTSVVNKSPRTEESKDGIDKCWHVAALAFFIAFFESATMRSTGFLYVGIMEELGVDRSSASWPVSLMGSVNDIGGLVSGPLSQIFSPVPVLIVGSWFAWVGILASSFTNSTTMMSLTMGAVHGFGVGTIMTMAQVIISMYFQRYRGAAYGIMFAGSTASSFVFPKLLLFLKETYTFRQSLFLLSAILMNMTVVGLLFKVPAWVKRERMESKKSGGRPSIYSLGYEPRESIKPPESLPSRNGVREALNHVVSVLKSPTFYVILTSWVFLCYSMDIFFASIVDFARDRGISVSDAVSLIPYFSVTDLVGRTLLPLLSDRKWVKRSFLATINFLIMGVTMFMLPIATSYEYLLVLCLFAAMFMGCAMTMHSVLMADYIGLERLAVAYGMLGVVTGPSLATKALLMGYFRDVVGAYDNMFRILGTILVFVSILWLGVVVGEQRKKKLWRLDVKYNIPCTTHI